MLENYISNHDELAQYLVREFVDDGVSGVSFNRPGIQSLLSEVKGKKVAYIVVKDLAQFGRNHIEVGDYIEQIFPFLGVRFIAVSDNFDSFKSPAGLDIGFRNLMHDLYSQDLSKKIKSVKKLMQEKGDYSGGDVPYGYMRGSEKEISTVRPWETKRNEESEYIKIEGHHDGLVTEELFREAQKAIRVCRKRETYKKEENPSPLKGEVKCGCCGYSMSLKRAVKKQYYYCRMGSGCGSYLKIGLEPLEKTVWGVLQKLAETYHEEEKACQSKKVQILSAVSKMKERKRILEIQAEHCKTNRLDLYYQWKEGRIAKEEYAIRKDELTKQEAESRSELELLDQQMAETVLVQNLFGRDNGNDNTIGCGRADKGVGGGAD